jgi:FPC/CPF motif-containing protein YcgG
MKRDWDIIREILIKFEEHDPKNGGVQLSGFPGDKAYEYSYHVELLLEAGLVHGHMSKTIGRHAQNFIVDRLTWAGHEFLDAIRSDTVWNKTKNSFIKGGLTMTFDLVKKVATDVATAIIKTAITS